MYIDDEHYFSNTSRGRMQGLDLTQPMYIGGVPNFFTISKQNGFETGFVGKCLIKNVYWLLYAWL